MDAPHEVHGGPQVRSPLFANYRRGVQKRQQYLTYIPWWRQPFVGYVATLPLLAVSSLIPYFLQRLGTHNYFVGAAFFLLTVLIALIWGTGPAVFSILLGALTLDLFFLPPIATFVVDWREAIPLLLFLLAEAIVAVLTAQRESARQNALFTQQEIETRVDELEQVNRQLEQTNQELAKANQLKDHFLSMASHELKTPITTIRGHVQMWQRRLAKQPQLPPELEQLRTALEKVDQQTHRLHGLVDDLLDVSLLSAGKMALRYDHCDIGEMCREVVADQQTLSGRTIELEVPDTPVIIQADRERLSQVVINLVTNALKYSPEQSAIHVRVSQQATETVLLQVHNDGQAIPQEQQTHIFEPFYRTPDARTSSKQGWGLGLAISKDIVERHRGKIWLESSEGNGTTFYVQIPMRTD